MQSPPKTAVFESDLAPLLSAFVAEKQRFGFKYNSIEAYLKSFDTFLLGRDCKNSLSKELMLEWIAPKAHQKSATIEHRIYSSGNTSNDPALWQRKKSACRSAYVTDGNHIAKVSEYVAFGRCAETR